MENKLKKYVKQKFTIRFVFCFDYDSRNILRAFDLAVSIFTTFASIIITKTISTAMNTRFVTNVGLTATRIRTIYTRNPYIVATTTTTAAGAAAAD